MLKSGNTTAEESNPGRDRAGEVKGKESMKYTWKII